MDINKLNIAEIETAPPRLELTAAEIAELADELVGYHAEFAELYYRLEQAHWGHKYLQGLMLPIERKSIQPMALALDGGNIQAMQQFIGQGRWQDEPLLARHRQSVNETLGEEDGVFIVDESAFPKRGGHSVGVARQWCGATGKVDNCQVGVFAAYASRKGYTLVDRRLFLPEEWFDEAHAQRRQKCGLPPETTFQTKPALGLEMLQSILAEGGLHGRWVAVDELYGRSTGFLDGVAELGLWYLAEVPLNTCVWQTRPQTEVPPWSGRGRRPTRRRLAAAEPSAQQVDAWAAEIPADQWQPYLIKEGSQGPMVAHFAFRRVIAVRDGLPGPEVWLVFRRSLGPESELKAFLSNAPVATPKMALVRVVGMRWPIETVIEECKDGLGMDHYEVRTWLGWHHHMTMCLLAHHFLVRTRLRLKKTPQP
jgi:SRSO17 transposase